jgi:hypothetical protein
MSAKKFFSVPKTIFEFQNSEIINTNEVQVLYNKKTFEFCFHFLGIYEKVFALLFWSHFKSTIWISNYTLIIANTVHLLLHIKCYIQKCAEIMKS